MRMPHECHAFPMRIVRVTFDFHAFQWEFHKTVLRLPCVLCTCPRHPHDTHTINQNATRLPVDFCSIRPIHKKRRHTRNFWGSCRCQTGLAGSSHANQIRIRRDSSASNYNPATLLLDLHTTPQDPHTTPKLHDCHTPIFTFSKWSCGHQNFAEFCRLPRDLIRIVYETHATPVRLPLDQSEFGFAWHSHRISWQWYRGIRKASQKKMILFMFSHADIIIIL